MSKSMKVTSVRMSENQVHQIKLKYGSFASWVTKNYIKEFGDDENTQDAIIKSISKMLTSGALKKSSLKKLLNN